MNARLSLALMLMLAGSASAKHVEIRWPEVPDAAAYQIELRNATRVMELKRLPARDQRWRIDLPPGIYRYRVRAIDDVDRPGDWSPLSSLVIAAPPPVLTAPQERTPCLPGRPVAIEWRRVARVTRYRVRVYRELREIWQDTVEARRVLFTPTESGRFAVKVSSLVGEGMLEREGEPSRPAAFVVGAPPEPPVTRVVATLREVRDPPPVSLEEWYTRTQGSIFLATGLLPYSYRTDNGSSQAHLATSARAADILTGGEWWWNAHWGLGGFFDSRMYRIGGQSGDTHQWRQALQYRRQLAAEWGSVIGYAGPTIRDYLQAWPDNQRTLGSIGSLDSRSVIGLDLGATWYRPVARRWALSLEAEAFLILSTMESRPIDTSLAYPNLRLAAGAHYWLAEHWQASAGLSYEVQQARFGTVQRSGYTEGPDGIHLDLWQASLSLRRLF